MEDLPEVCSHQDLVLMVREVLMVRPVPMVLQGRPVLMANHL